MNVYKIFDGLSTPKIHEIFTIDGGKQLHGKAILEHKIVWAPLSDNHRKKDDTEYHLGLLPG